MRLFIDNISSLGQNTAVLVIPKISSTCKVLESLLVSFNSALSQTIPVLCTRRSNILLSPLFSRLGDDIVPIKLLDLPDVLGCLHQVISLVGVHEPWPAPRPSQLYTYTIFPEKSQSSSKLRIPS